MDLEATDANDAGPRDALLMRAVDAGCELATRETDTGQIVWEWRRATEPRPQFVSERVARQWMSRWLDDHDAGRCSQNVPDSFAGPGTIGNTLLAI